MSFGSLGETLVTVAEHLAALLRLEPADQIAHLAGAHRLDADPIAWDRLADIHADVHAGRQS